jgi:nitric oxide reductase large subunit
MQYGSIFGHGAYLGPDFTAEGNSVAGASRIVPGSPGASI